MRDISALQMRPEVARQLNEKSRAHRSNAVWLRFHHVCKRLLNFGPARPCCRPKFNVNKFPSWHIAMPPGATTVPSSVASRRFCIGKRDHPASRVPDDLSHAWELPQASIASRHRGRLPMNFKTCPSATTCETQLPEARLARL